MAISRHQSFVPLYERIIKYKNLRRAFAHIRDKAGKRYPKTSETPREWMKKNLVDSRIKELQAEIILQDYRPKDYEKAFVGNGTKKREVVILHLADRIVARACYQVLSQVFDSRLNNCNFGYRPHRNRGQAAVFCQQIIRNGNLFWVKADVSSCFGSIRRRRLTGIIKSIFQDDSLIYLLGLFVDLERKPTGIVQGGSLSPFFSNIYLDEVDNELARNGHLFAHYGDDYAIGCKSKEEADEALDLLNNRLNSINLSLSSDKTRILDLRETSLLNFCGFAISKGQIAVNEQSAARMREKAVRLIDNFVTSGVKSELDELEQDSLADDFFSSHRERERAKKKLLEQSSSLTMVENIVVPRFLKYIKNWKQQFEVVDDKQSFQKALKPVFEYMKQKGLVSPE